MKEFLRKNYINVRKNIINKKNKNDIIYEKVIINNNIIYNNIFLVYVSKQDEVFTMNIIKYLLESNKKVAVPKIENDNMNFFYIDSLDDLRKGYYNILEPTTNNICNDADVAIIPGICFDLNGYRIGYGKGYYDRYLSNKNIIKIGLCYSECLIKNTYPDKHDIKMDQIITD